MKKLLLCAYARKEDALGRNKKKRCCRVLEGEKFFKPRSIPVTELEITLLELDEFEAVRLCDFDKLSQIEAAEKMQVSRGTIQRLLESARFKIVDALLHDKALQISQQPDE